MSIDSKAFLQVPIILAIVAAGMGGNLDRRKAIAEAAFDAVVTVDGDARILELNAAAERMFGWAEAEVLGRHFGELLVPPDDLAMRAERFRGLVALPDGAVTNPPVDMTLLHRTGAPVLVRTTALRTTVDGAPALIAFFHDLTARRQVEAALRAQEHSYRELVHGLQALVWERDLESRSFTHITGRVADILGYPPDSFLGNDEFLLTVIHREDLPRLEHALRSALRNGSDSVQLEYRVSAADGRVVWSRDSVRITRDKGGRRIRLRGVALDVTEQRRAELLIREAQEETIVRLARAAEAHDEDTGLHIERMSAYCGLLARLAGIDDEQAELIRRASSLHDIGKIGVPDSILLKPGPLTPDEWRIMDRHTVIGHRILAGSSSPLLELAATIALTHHERVDGTGKPHGLVDDQIPIEGRIAAVADVFDALSSDRPYRRALPLAQVVAALRENAGVHLDGPLVRLFLRELDTVLVFA